jgi:hypothetical protein
MKKKSTTSDIVPSVGMGATIQYWSDRKAGTIIRVDYNGRRLVIQLDKPIRIDQNGMSECQEYEYHRNPEGTIYIATLRKDGGYRVSKTKMSVALDVRDEYYDYSF